MINSTQGTYSKIERGNYAGLSGLKWMILCDLLEIRPESIFSEDLTQNIFKDTSKNFYSISQYLIDQEEKRGKIKLVKKYQSSNRTRMWSNNLVLDLLFKLYCNNKPFYPSYVIKNDYVLYQNAIKRFGSWDEALIRANIPKELVALAVSKRRVLSVHNNILDNYFEDENEIQMCELATVYFGTLDSALNNFYQSSDEYKLNSKFGILFICKRLFDRKGDLNSKVIFKSQIPSLLYSINQKFSGVDEVKNILIGLNSRQKEILSVKNIFSSRSA